MPGTELAIREEDFARRDLMNYHHYLSGSIRWSWEVITWLLDPVYVSYAKRDEAVTICWEALQRNLKWQEQQKELEAAEAFQAVMRAGVATADQLAVIMRHDGTAVELFQAVEDSLIASGYEAAPRPVYGPAMTTLKGSVDRLRAFLDSEYGEGFLVSGDEDGGFTVWQMGTDNEAYIVKDETGNWRHYYQNRGEL